MPTKIRNLKFVPTMTAMGKVQLPNLLVAGCSYVWNNSEHDACTWPYYLQDALQFSQVLDCSQSGSGPTLCLNSVINETITGYLSPANTLICVMWPGLERTDVIASYDDDLRRHHHMSLYQFDKNFANATLSAYADYSGDIYDRLAHLYKRTIPFSAQQYQNLINIVALGNYLSNQKFHFVFLTWKSWDLSLLINHGVPEILVSRAHDLILPMQSLDDFAEKNSMRIPNDGHPTPDAHMRWTKTNLVPALAGKFPSLISLD